MRKSIAMSLAILLASVTMAAAGSGCGFGKHAASTHDQVIADASTTDSAMSTFDPAVLQTEPAADTIVLEEATQE